MNRTPVAGIATPNSYLGQFTVNPRPINFTDFNDPQPSYMTLLKEQNYIPSLSFGYTAGAQYRLKKALGSLILGGYDTSLFISDTLTFTFGTDQSRDLLVGLQAITTNITGKTTSLMSEGIFTLIDSTVSQLWLPLSVCQAFESAFGLVYNETYNLYMVSNSTHEKLLASNPSVTLFLGNDPSGGQVINITLPYAAFDLTAAYPLTGEATLYFPLQRAMNDTQYTLGRTFLQEAYIIVDYERSNFSVRQCYWDQDVSQNVVAILPVNITTSSSSPTTTTNASSSSDSGLSIGAKAGIVVGCVMFFLLVVGMLIFFFVLPRYKKRKVETTTVDDASTKAEQLPQEPQELYGQSAFSAQEIDSRVKAHPELEGDTGNAVIINELGAEVITYEMHGSDVSELHGRSSSVNY